LAISSQKAAGPDRRAQLLMRKGRVDEAVELLSKSADECPGDPFLIIHLGLALLRKGQADDAAAQFQKAVVTAPAMPAPCVFLGAALLDLGNPSDALAGFNNAVRIDKTYSTARAWQGLAVMASGNVADGLARIRRHRQFADNPMLGSRILAFCEEYVSARGGPPFGDEQPAPGFAMRIDDYYDRLERGVLAPAEKVIGDAIFAVSSLERLVAPKRFEARSLWRQAYADAARNDKQSAAQKSLKRLELVSFDADSFLWTLWMQYECGDYETTLKLLKVLEEEIREPATEHPVPAEILSRIQYRNGEYDAAIKSVMEHSESRVSDHGPRYVRGLALLRRGERANALRWFEETLDRPNPRLLDARLRDVEELVNRE